MNVMMNVDLDAVAPANPCCGCVSLNCKSCSCVGEAPKPRAFEHRSAAQKKRQPRKTAGRREATLVPEMQETERKHSVIDKLFGGPAQYIELPKGLFGGAEGSMILRVEGNGMVNAGIQTGDWLVFDPNKGLKDGDIALVTVDGQPMCRRVFHEGDKTRIRREDGVTPDVISENCVIYAVLVGLMRNYQGSLLVEMGG